MELDPSAACPGASVGSREHRRAKVDTDYLRDRRVIGDIPSGADARIEDSAGQPLEEVRTNVAIASVLEREIKKVVERRDTLIAVEERGHKCHPYGRTS